jgi:CheY-like chemotaxis protein
MPNQHKKILIFDEDYESMRDLKEHLEQELHYDVVLTAEASLPERLQRERFDLILVDIMIHPKSPDAMGHEVDNIHFNGISWVKTGLEFLRLLRQGEFRGAGDTGTSPNVPVILLSAVASDSLTAELKEHQLAQAYMTKPYRFSEILSKINSNLKG